MEKGRGKERMWGNVGLKVWKWLAWVECSEVGRGNWADIQDALAVPN